MDCKLISTGKKRVNAGFSILEFLIGGSVGLLTLLATSILWGYSSRTFAVVAQYADLCNSAKLAMDRMSQQLRNAQCISECSSNRVVIIDFDGQTRQFTFLPRDKKLVQSINGVETDLLTDCQWARFSYYQRTPQRGTDVLSTASGTNTCKVVQLAWTCSRPVPGVRNVTQNEVSAKVVLRNQ